LEKLVNQQKAQITELSSYLDKYRLIEQQNATLRNQILQMEDKIKESSGSNIEEYQKQIADKDAQIQQLHTYMTSYRQMEQQNQDFQAKLKQIEAQLHETGLRIQRNQQLNTEVQELKKQLQDKEELIQKLEPYIDSYRQVEQQTQQYIQK
jgi:chromosome segregation ATPase